MGYENAAATKMVAVYCASCGRDLVDAKSVETGMGPVCRKRYLTKVEVPEANRRAANKVVHRVACLAGEGKRLEALSLALSLKELGFEALPDRIGVRLAGVRIRNLSDTSFAVEAPFCADALGSWRRVGRWMGKVEGGGKFYAVPATNRAKLWKLIRSYYPGVLGVVFDGPKAGAFAVPVGVES